MKKPLIIYLEKELQKIYNKYNIKLNPTDYDLKSRVLLYESIRHLNIANTDNDALIDIIDSIGEFYNIDILSKHLEFVYEFQETSDTNIDIEYSSYINDMSCNFILHNNLIMDISRLIYDVLKKPFDIEKELSDNFKYYADEVYKNILYEAKNYFIPIVLGKTDKSLIDVLDYIFTKDFGKYTANEFKDLKYLAESLKDIAKGELKMYPFERIVTIAPRFVIDKDDAIGGTHFNLDLYNAVNNEDLIKYCYTKAFVFAAEIFNNLNNSNLDDTEINEIMNSLLDMDNSSVYSSTFFNSHFYSYVTNEFNHRVFDIMNENDMEKRFKLLEDYYKFIDSEIDNVVKNNHESGKDYMPHLLASIVQTLEDYSYRTNIVKTYLMLIDYCKNKGINLINKSIAMPNIGLDLGDSGAVESFNNSLLNLNNGCKYEETANTKSSDIDKSKDKINELKATNELLDKAVSSFKEDKYDYRVEYVKESIKAGDSRIAGYNNLVSSVKLINKTLIKQIRDIKTYNVGGKNSGLTKGKLDSKNLYKYQDTPNIFYNNHYKIKEMDLAFGILLDVSGSMNGQGIEDGKVTMVLLHETLKSLGINHCICTHNAGDFHNCKIKKYQPFKEDKNYTVDKCYSLFDIQAYGGNCDSGALYYMEKEFARVRNKDKICIIFSDGEPTECSDIELKEQVANMERHGIRVIGVGINFESIKEYYPHNANGKNLKQMINIVTDILKEYVLEKAK